jgi:hypothetical protein
VSAREDRVTGCCSNPTFIRSMSECPFCHHVDCRCECPQCGHTDCACSCCNETVSTAASDRGIDDDARFSDDHSVTSSETASPRSEGSDDDDADIIGIPRDGIVSTRIWETEESAPREVRVCRVRLLRGFRLLVREEGAVPVGHVTAVDADTCERLNGVLMQVADVVPIESMSDRGVILADAPSTVWFRWEEY